MINKEELKAKYAHEDRIVVVVSDIKWDTDGETPEELGLPTEVELIIGKDIMPCGWLAPTTEEVSEEVAEYLTRAYGYYHDGFSLDYF